MRVRINIRHIEQHLAEHPNKDKTTRELAEIWGYSESTMRKKCQKLVLDEKSRVALLVYQRVIKMRNGKCFFRWCGGYCVIDSANISEELHARIDETIEWASNLSVSAKKLVLKSFTKEANRKVLPAHHAHMKRLGFISPDDNYESYYQFG